MKFKTLDGREIRREILPSRYPIRSKEDSKSKGQYNLGRLLCKLYPQSSILEEFTLPGMKLRLDFFLPREKLAFEFQGIQHSQMNKFFHESPQAFARSLERDREKLTWCEINDIHLVYIHNPNLSLIELKRLIIE